MLGLRRRNLVGLDIDTSAVRMVQVRKDNGGYVIVKAAVTDITPWGNDPQLHRLHTIQAIREGLSSTGISTKYAVCGLRGPEVVVRDFEFPALTPEEIAGAVELEVSQICPFLAEESTFGFQVTSNNDKKTMGFWVAATNDLIQNTRQLVSEAGLHCALVDVAGLALLNLLEAANSQRTEDGRQRTAPSSVVSPPSSGPPAFQNAVLNLGDSCVSIAIADSAGRPFVRDLGSGVAVESSVASAAGRLATHGSFSAEDGWATRNDYRPALQDSLVEDVLTTLRYYAAQNGSARVDRLLVCGGSAATEESVESLRTRLNIEVEPWNPLTDCGLRIADCGLEDAGDTGQSSPICDLQLYGRSLAVATGLAMRSI
jgi:type IV pilus assembly protein PilM